MSEKITISALVEQCRYSSNLDTLLDTLGGVKEVLRLNYEASYSGFVDVDALLNDGRVFTYKYWYGSCSGCDTWESNDFNDAQIEDVMRMESTIFPDLDTYKKWRETCPPTDY